MYFPIIYLSVPRSVFCAIILACVSYATAQEQKARPAVFRVGDRLLEVREAAYAEEIGLTKGFLEIYNRLQNIVRDLRPELILLHEEFNNEATIDIKKEIEEHFQGLEIAAFYEAHKLSENHHEAAVQQERAKVAYLENRICYMMREHFGESGGFDEWARKWQKEFPLELPEAEAPVNFHKEVFASAGIKVSLENRAPEGQVTSDDVYFEVIENDSGFSTKGKGNTVHTHEPDGTPKRFLGYEFESEGIHFYISRFGDFEKTSKEGNLLLSEKLEPISH